MSRHRPPALAFLAASATQRGNPSAKTRSCALTPAWPALSAFFAAASALAMVAEFASRAAAVGNHAVLGPLWWNLALGLAAAVLAGLGFGVAAVAAMAGEIAVRRRPLGCRSWRILLLAILGICLLGPIADHISLTAHGLNGSLVVSDFAVMALILVFFVAWPAAHVTGLACGIAAVFARGDRPLLGAAGALLNSAALAAWYAFVVLDPPRPALIF